MTESPIFGLTPILFVFLIFYLLVFRPQHKQMKQKQKMLSELKKGDCVLTASGIYGVIVNIKGDIIELKVAENTKIKITKESVTAVVDKSKIEW